MKGMLRFGKEMTCMLMLAALLMSTLHSGAIMLDRNELGRHTGTGFWTDPCTWDGFIVGATTILCPTTIGACITGISALYKAMKVDNCFG